MRYRNSKRKPRFKYIKMSLFILLLTAIGVLTNIKLKKEDLIEPATSEIQVFARSIEEEKQKFFLSHKNIDVCVLHDEVGPSKISEQLMEDSLFGDAKVFCLINLPILKKAGQKESQEWDALAELLMNYTGDNPVLIIYHDMVDKRLKQNKKILESIPNKECKRLEGDD